MIDCVVDFGVDFGVVCGVVCGAGHHGAPVVGKAVAGIRCKASAAVGAKPARCTSACNKAHPADQSPRPLSPLMCPAAGRVATSLPQPSAICCPRYWQTAAAGWLSAASCATAAACRPAAGRVAPPAAQRARGRCAASAQPRRPPDGNPGCAPPAPPGADRPAVRPPAGPSSRRGAATTNRLAAPGEIPPLAASGFASGTVRNPASQAAAKSGVRSWACFILAGSSAL